MHVSVELIISLSPSFGFTRNNELPLKLQGDGKNFDTYNRKNKLTIKLQLIAS